MQIEQLLVHVIEPSHMQRKVITSTLHKLGVQDIEEFDAGRPALDRMKVITPDVVISSMHLPDMTGTDLVHEMRDTPALEDITFLLISSETHIRYLEPVRQSGAIAILPKPFDEKDLALAINSTIAYIDSHVEEGEDEQFEFLRVLLADDSRMSRKFLRQTLESIGIKEIDEVENGAAALVQLENHEYDLIVSDYNMPEIDGRQLTEHIRSQSKQQSIPVLMVTSEQNNTVLNAIQKAGVSALCHKPVAYENMRLIIRNLLKEV